MEKHLGIFFFLLLLISNQSIAQDCTHDNCSSITYGHEELETTTIPPNSEKTCDVDPANRTTCNGLTENDCVVGWECCWDSTDRSCYYKGIVMLEVNTTIQMPVTTEEATTSIKEKAITETATTPESAEGPAATTTATPLKLVAETSRTPEEAPATESVGHYLSSTKEAIVTDPSDDEPTTEAPVSEEIPNDKGDDDDDVHTFTISSVLVDPYLMEKKNISDDVEGNDRYEGFIKDYLDELAKRMGMNYRLLVRDQYGKKVKGSWTGVIGDVVNKDASFAAAPLIVTVEREKVVDFTWSIFSFEAVVVMQRRHPEQTPKIKSFKDLVNQLDKEIDKKVLLGATSGSPIVKEMEHTNDPLITEAWRMIEKHSYLMKATTNECFQRARRDNQYAFLTDEMTAEYVLREEPCELEMIKAGFFKRRLAFAVANQDPLNDQLNEEILGIETSGEKQKLFDKWWGEKCVNGVSVTTASVTLVFLALYSHLW